jgi:hypothetical protein
MHVMLKKKDEWCLNFSRKKIAGLIKLVTLALLLS